MKLLITLILLISSVSYAKDPVAVLRASSVHIAVGSGSIVEAPSGKHYLLTNGHVCAVGSWNHKMRANFEGGELVEGKIAKTSLLFDLCASLVDKKFPAIQLGKKLYYKEQIYTRGYPFGVLSETSGQYLGISEWDYDYPIEMLGECPKGSRKLYDGMEHVAGCRIHYSDYMTNMYSRPGSSGSPIVNQAGELVGVMSSWFGEQDLGGMVSTPSLLEFMKDL